MTTERLASQIAFIVEIDKAKHVLRQTLLVDGSRRENDAEHSWHLAVMALLLAEYAAEPIDVGGVVRLVLVHDLVEIDAGDTFVYDTAAARDKEARERRAADRLFGLLPDDQARDLHALWQEYEARETPESRFAFALDRLQPLLHNYQTQGAAWRRHGVTSEQVIAQNRRIAQGAPALWDFAQRLIRESVRKGYLAP